MYFLSHTSTNLLLVPLPKSVEADFSNVGTMIESGLFSEALDSIRDTLCPGLLPPAAFLVSLLEHALQVPPRTQLTVPAESYWLLRRNGYCYRPLNNKSRLRGSGSLGQMSM